MKVTNKTATPLGLINKDGARVCVKPYSSEQKTVNPEVYSAQIIEVMRLSGDASVAADDPAPVVVPSITGSAEVGETLTANEGDWNDPVSIKLQWQRGNSASGEFNDISGASLSTYTLTSDDLAKYIRIKVTATGADSEAIVYSAAVGPVAA